MKLWIMNVDTKTKVLLKFRSLGTVCVDGGCEAKKATEIVTLPIHVKLGFMYTLSDIPTHNTLSVGYETLDYECRHLSHSICDRSLTVH